MLSRAREQGRREQEDARREMLATEKWQRAQALQAASRVISTTCQPDVEEGDLVLQLARIFEQYIEEGTWPRDPEARR